MLCGPMSKPQKWCLNYTQVCMLVRTGGCLYTVRWDTPHVSLSVGAHFLCWHQNRLGIPGSNAKVFCFAYYLLKGRAAQKLRGKKMRVCYTAKT